MFALKRVNAGETAGIYKEFRQKFYLFIRFKQTTSSKQGNVGIGTDNKCNLTRKSWIVAVLS